MPEAPEVPDTPKRPKPPDLRRHSPAAERNRQPILTVLLRLLPARGEGLEIASGSGQHIAWFAAALPAWRWLPTDADPMALASIDAWCQQAGVPNVRPAVQLDVMVPRWPVSGRFDAIFCANMLHIAPWPTCAALMQGAARLLAPQGVLITYGPYLQDEVPTSPCNLAFDASLRQRDPAWGIRRVKDVVKEATRCGLQLAESIAMPAHNRTLVFARSEGPVG